MIRDASLPSTIAGRDAPDDVLVVAGDDVRHGSSGDRPVVGPRRLPVAYAAHRADRVHGELVILLGLLLDEARDAVGPVGDDLRPDLERGDRLFQRRGKAAPEARTGATHSDGPPQLQAEVKHDPAVLALQVRVQRVAHQAVNLGPGIDQAPEQRHLLQPRSVEHARCIVDACAEDPAVVGSGRDRDALPIGGAGPVDGALRGVRDGAPPQPGAARLAAIDDQRPVLDVHRQVDQLPHRLVVDVVAGGAAHAPPIVEEIAGEHAGAEEVDRVHAGDRLGDGVRALVDHGLGLVDHVREGGPRLFLTHRDTDAVPGAEAREAEDGAHVRVAILLGGAHEHVGQRLSVDRLDRPPHLREIDRAHRTTTFPSKTIGKGLSSQTLVGTAQSSVTRDRS